MNNGKEASGYDSLSLCCGGLKRISHVLWWSERAGLTQIEHVYTVDASVVVASYCLCMVLDSFPASVVSSSFLFTAWALGETRELRKMVKCASSSVAGLCPELLAP